MKHTQVSWEPRDHIKGPCYRGIDVGVSEEIALIGIAPNAWENKNQEIFLVLIPQLTVIFQKVPQWWKGARIP